MLAETRPWFALPGSPWLLIRMSFQEFSRGGDISSHCKTTPLTAPSQTAGPAPEAGRVNNCRVNGRGPTFEYRCDENLPRSAKSSDGGRDLSIRKHPDSLPVQSEMQPMPNIRHQLWLASFRDIVT